MIVRSLDGILNTERDVDWGSGHSRRLLLKRDGMGFALADTTVTAGTEVTLQYKNHVEACYVIEGTGELEFGNGQVEPIRPGLMYALDQHDRHTVRAHTDLRIVSVFNPPIEGPERHSLKPGEASSY